MTDESDSEPKIVFQASPACIERMATRPPDGKPDFTVTSAVIDSMGDEGFVIAWETESAGFGTVTVYRDETGIMCCETETMGLGFVKSVFAKFLDGLEIRE